MRSVFLQGELQMLTSKQRAKLRSIASTEDTILQLGKGGVTENFVKSVDDALNAREIVKFRVLESAMLSPIEAATEVAEQIGAQVVTCIGSKAVLYRRSEDDILQI